MYCHWKIHTWLGICRACCLLVLVLMPISEKAVWPISSLHHHRHYYHPYYYHYRPNFSPTTMNHSLLLQDREVDPCRMGVYYVDVTQTHLVSSCKLLWITKKLQTKSNYTTTIEEGGRCPKWAPRNQERYMASDRSHHRGVILILMSPQKIVNAAGTQHLSYSQIW